MQVLVSDRKKEVDVLLRSTGLVVKAIPSSETEGEDSPGGALFAELPALQRFGDS